LKDFVMQQFITFQIGEQVLGIDIMAVREIRAWSPTTALPHVANHVRGVVNLRGTVLPVMDLRARLGWGETDPSARHVIMVVRVNEQLQGLIVDAVNDIVTIDEENLQAPPDVSGNRLGGSRGPAPPFFALSSSSPPRIVLALRFNWDTPVRTSLRMR
jgi:purine-binding chemotaxis protein CheW